MKLKIKKSTLKIMAVVAAAIIVLLISFYLSPAPPAITSTQPQDKKRNILDDSSIIITFDRILTRKDERLLKLSITPDVIGEQIFENNILTFKPNLLDEDQQYDIKVLYEKVSIHNFSFTTNLYSTEEIKLQGQQQIKDDYLFNKKFEQAVKEYPWYPQLPIKTKEYNIYYDFDLELFRIRILSPSIDDEELDIVTQKALESLLEIGVPEPIKHKVLKTN